jgi:hypothetical protein
LKKKAQLLGISTQKFLLRLPQHVQKKKKISANSQSGLPNHFDRDTVGVFVWCKLSREGFENASSFVNAAVCLSFNKTPSASHARRFHPFERLAFIMSCDYKEISI